MKKARREDRKEGGKDEIVPTARRHRIAGRNVRERAVELPFDARQSSRNHVF
jgi:hypothetical protein